MKRVGSMMVIALTIGAIAGAGAQTTLEKGYIINSAGDTLKGQIKYNPKNDLGLYESVSFQTNPTDKKAYHANKIKEFAIEGITFVSRVIDDKPVFIRKLSGGAVNLYQYKTEEMVMNGVHTYVDYYMEKPGSKELVHIKESKFKKQLSEIMSDDKSLIKDIEEKKYDFGKIVELFEQYNKNKGS
jgi:DNA-directed RNA polymerase beta' subunit